jgi:intraflagellar transport protein 122
MRGTKEREWALQGVIRYVKPMGGDQEDFIVGLATGHVLHILINSSEPVQLLKHSVALRCVDINCRRKIFAFVDENQRLYVHDVETKALLYEDTKANSVAWNTCERESETFCYSGDGALAVNDLGADAPKHSQPQRGFAVSFTGSKVFCVHANGTGSNKTGGRPFVVVEVPLQPGVESGSVRQEDKDLEPEPEPEGPA